MNIKTNRKTISQLLILTILLSVFIPIHAISEQTSISSSIVSQNQIIPNQTINDTDTSSSISSSRLPIPFGLLQNWLQIPPAIQDDKTEILLIGNLLPLNYTRGQNYSGRLRSSDLIGSRINESTFSDDSLEVIEILEFLLDPNPINFWPNLRVHWVSMEFDRLVSDNLYEDEVASFFNSNITIADYSSVIVMETYFGHPFDAFNTVLLKFNEKDIPVFAKAVVGQPFGDMLSPANNPGVIAIATLILENDDYSEFIHYNQFRLKYQFPIIQNELYKTSPDFLMPGESILVSNSSGINLLPVYKEYNSERLPLVLFAMFYLSHKLSIPTFSPIKTNRDTLQLLTQTSIYLNEPAIRGAQNGFGIAQFDIMRERLQVIKPFEMNPFDTNENEIEQVTTGQEFYTVIEIIPAITNITLNQLKIIFRGSTSTIKVQSDPILLNITKELNIHPVASAWTTANLIPVSLKFGNIPDEAFISVGVEFGIEDEIKVVVKQFKVDNNRNLLGIPLFLEKDGLYKSDLPFNRFYKAFSGLDIQGWSISLFSEMISLETEIDKFDHDVVVLLDPDIYPNSLETLLDKYVDRGGNVMYFLDDDSTLKTYGDINHGLTSYFPVDQNLTNWVYDHGYDLESFNSDDDPTLIKVFESGSPLSQSPYYLTPFISTSNIFHSIPLYPFRGFILDGHSVNTTNRITEFRNATKIGVTMKNNRGLNSIIGTTSVFVDGFDGFPIKLELPDQTEILNGLLLMGSGSAANLTVTDIKNPTIFRNRVHVEVASNRVYPELQKSRWQYRLTGPETDEKTYDINTKLLKIFPSFFSHGKTNLSVQILFNQRIIDEVIVSISLQTSIMNKILVYVIWIALVSVSIVLYKRNKTLISENKS